ncbi:hypothetical protein AAF712_007118 [Marasmius tenuissimus]|uniref:Uncharacterized protein n=1 Tax=Marasmius tenuissimus TaxID=585030 RepID=A0ABR2ZWV2_9AGAR
MGGATIVEGGRPPVILASGYLGSTFLGALFVLAGWNILVAKVMSFVLASSSSFVRRYSHAFTLKTTNLDITIITGDVADDRFFHKANDSDATQFAILYPSIGPHSM